MNLLQQNSLITYSTSHKGNCDCKDCEYFGGVNHLFEIYSPNDFTDHLLRKVWSWLKIQFELNGTCMLDTLNFEDPLAPKVSEITQAHLDSYTEPYQKLKDLIII